MGRAIRTSLATALVVALVVFAFVACGKNAGRGRLQAAHFVREQQIGGLETAAPDPLAELDALACPDGVDDGLWAELKGALEEALISQEESRLSSRDSVGKESRLENRDSLLKEQDGHPARAGCPYKSVATPPQGEANRVNDLAISDNGDGTYSLTWHYRNLGDYDQNGIVAVEDIIPLAEHFGESVPEDDTDRNSLQAIIDGSGNGRVGIEDITPIAANIGVDVDHYAIEGSAAEEGPWEVVGEVVQSTGTGDGRLAYQHVLTGAPHRWYRVVPQDSEGVSGEPSESALSPLFQEWVHTWGGSGDDYGQGVAVDADGNVYLSGYTRSFGAGSDDVFLFKYSPVGNLLWQRTWGGSASDCARGLACDSSGNTYMTGWTWSFGAGEGDAFVLKYSCDGSVLWRQTWGGSASDLGIDVAVVGSGNVYITGKTLSFGAGNSDVVILKLSSEGDILWQRTWGGDDHDGGMAITADSSGSAYIAGGTESFGAGNADIVLLKYGSDGSLLWEQTWGGSDRCWGYDIAVDASGCVLLAGYTHSFGAGSDDVVLLKYSPVGDLLWQRTWGGSESDWGVGGVATDGGGNVYVAAQTLSMGAGWADVAVLEYSRAGDLLQQRTWGDNDAQYANTLTVGRNGLLYVAGSAPRAHGSWQAATGMGTSPLGTEMTPNGYKGFPLGLVTLPVGTETTPRGTEDVGGGEADVLIMKIDPSRW